VRHFARLDANHPAIVAELRRASCGVISLATLGGGKPDILAWSPWLECYFLAEIKDGSKIPSARQLTADERLFHSTFPGPIQIVSSVEEALAMVGAKAAA